MNRYSGFINIQCEFIQYQVVMPFSIKRKKTRRIRVGNVSIGDMAPVVVQSMTNTFTQDIQSTVMQIHRLEKAGCELVRVAVPDHEAAVTGVGMFATYHQVVRAVPDIRKSIGILVFIVAHDQISTAIDEVGAPQSVAYMHVRTLKDYMWPG